MSDHTSAEIARLNRRLELMSGLSEALLETVRLLELSITCAIEVDGADSDILHWGQELVRTVTDKYDNLVQEALND